MAACQDQRRVSVAAGAVPVRAADGHAVLAAAPRAAPRRARQGPRAPPLPPHRGGRGGAGPQERGNTLLVSGKTQVCEQC